MDQMQNRLSTHPAFPVAPELGSARGDDQPPARPVLGQIAAFVARTARRLTVAVRRVGQPSDTLGTFDFVSPDEVRWRQIQRFHAGAEHSRLRSGWEPAAGGLRLHWWSERWD